MSQETLALDSGLDAAAVSRIENGTQNPTWATVRKLADALGVNVSDVAVRAEREDASGETSPT